MAAGDFSASALPYILEGADSVWTGDRHKKGIMEDVGPANQILQNQLVDWQLLFNNAGLNDAQRCVGAFVTWLKDCANVVDDCTTLENCDITGPEMESDNDQYAPNMCADITGLVKGKACNDFFDKARKIGVKIANMTYALDQDLQTRLETFVLANGQANRFANTYGTIEPPPSVWTGFDQAEWVAAIIGELVQTAKKNDLANYYGISGGLLYNAFYNSQFNNCCDSDANIFKGGGMPITWDLDNLDTIAGRQSFALVDPGAFGYFNANAYTSNTPVPHNRGSDLYIWRVASSRLSWKNGGTLQPVYYDFEIQEKCVVDGNLRYTDTAIRGVHRGGLHLAPPTCNADDTGIVLLGVTGEELPS